MTEVEAVERSSGSREAVWELIDDASAWERWGAWSRVEVEDGGPQREGAVRIVVRRPFTLRERLTEWVPGERMAYEILDGMNVTGYRGVVTLEEAPEGGTVVRWHSTWERAGPLTSFILRRAIRDACRRLARAASASA